jgi:thiol:disulfide interchange protein DsbD
MFLLARFPIVRLLLALLWLACSPFARADEEFLDPEVAFKFSARLQDSRTVAVTWQIADGYYMYRERFRFTAVGATLGEPKFPAGKIKYDDTFLKEVETYRHRVTILIPVQSSGRFTLKAQSQGCADKGLCYAPQEATATLGGALLLGGGGAGSMADAGAGGAGNAGTGSGAAGGAVSGGSELSGIAAVLGDGRLLVIVPAFVLLGLGLAFTPCVLPMVPILSSIIVGEGARAGRARGFVLSATYAIGMAIVYTLLGIAAGLIGEGLAAALQNPWVLGGFALLMVGMALSMFGVYTLQMPAALQSRLADASGRQRSGKLAGVFAMGALSALIVGPCVAAPLAGALVYISQTRDVLLGGAALFSMAMGMSIPLLLVGVSAGTLLPRAGPWMETVKRFFDVLMLAMALWLVSPVLPPAVQMGGWAALLLGYGAWLLRGRTGPLALAAGLAFAVLGSVQLAGLASGGRDPLAPLAHLGGQGQAHGLSFQRIKTVAELEAVLAAHPGRTAMLDFYADWCVSCKEMEKLTFVDARVRTRLDGTLLLQADVTANDAHDKALLKRFGLFGPPAIILFGNDGRELPDSRVIGFQPAERFLGSLARLDTPSLQ